MKILSVNTANKKTISWQGKTWQTGIFKREQTASITVTKNGVLNDVVVDKRYHGGEHLAVYGFSKKHYSFFQKYYQNISFYNGIFGENLTIDDLDERTLKIGDTFQIGSATLQISQPRLPCKTLNAVFKSNKMIQLFLNNTYSGVYFRVLKEGEIYKNDKLVLLNRENNSINVSDIYSLFTTNKENKELIKESLNLETLSPKIKKDIQRKLL